MGLAPNRVYRMDCVEGLGQVGPGSVDLAFADPPFNIGYEYDEYDDNRHADDYVQWCRDWLTGTFTALKDDGTFWLAIGDEFAAELKVAAQHIGFHCRSWIIWYYTFGVNCKNCFSRSHTHLFYFVKDTKRFTFNADNPAVRVPSARQLVYADARANPKGRLPDNTWILRPQDLPDGFSAEQDTWYFPRVAGTFKEREGFHGCQMPEQLLGRIIRSCSNSGDTVLDPFGGSGTTLAVAKKLGRQWIGFELSADYAKRIQKRLKATTVGDPLDGAEDPLKSAPTTKNGKQRGTPRRVSTPARKRQQEAVIAEMRYEVVEAYRCLQGASSVDHLLADPELNAAFAGECKRRRVPGQIVQWNRTLVAARKQGKLPRRDGRRKRHLSMRQMDPFMFASEIAMQQLRVEFDMTLDQVLCNPESAAALDRIAAEFAPGYSAFEYRWAALAVRKKAKKWKRQAAARFQEAGESPLPASISLSAAKWRNYDEPGVYILSAGTRRLYVGEALVSLAERIEQILQAPAWQQWKPTSVRLIPEANLEGLQSALIAKCRPLLNSHLLMPQVEFAT